MLSKRAEMVFTAGKLKKDEKGVRDPKRVEQVIEKVKAKASAAGLDPEMAEEVYRVIIGCFIRKEHSEFAQTMTVDINRRHIENPVGTTEYSM
ncbi:MAG: chorismate mutase [Nitrospirota bacterium]